MPHILGSAPMRNPQAVLPVNQAALPVNQAVLPANRRIRIRYYYKRAVVCTTLWFNEFHSSVLPTDRSLWAGRVSNGVTAAPRSVGSSLHSNQVSIRVRVTLGARCSKPRRSYVRKIPQSAHLRTCHHSVHVQDSDAHTVTTQNLAGVTPNAECVFLWLETCCGRYVALRFDETRM